MRRIKDRFIHCKFSGQALQKYEIMNLEIPTFLQNPINLALLGVLGYLIYQETRPLPTLKPSAPIEKKVIEQRDFTPKELAQFNGMNGSKIYLAIEGKVYDVSGKADFYGPGSMYENFSGRDASRGLAKHSFERDILTDLDKPIDDLEDLNAEERQSLKEWSEFFSGKYTVVGRLTHP